MILSSKSPFLHIELRKHLELMRILVDFLYSQRASELNNPKIALLFIPLAAERLSGHKSSAQKYIGMRCNIFTIAAGTPTVTGDVSCTIIQSKRL